MNSFFGLLCLIISFEGTYQLHSSLLPPTDDVSMIFVGFRHGYRNPAQFLKNDPGREQSGWGWEGVSQLTLIGKQQAFGLGRFLRRRYATLLPVNYMPSEIKATSSSAERCQMTLMSVMAGAFPPIGKAMWNRDLIWQPFSFNIDDPLLRMYNVDCPTYKRVYQPISDDNIPQSTEWLTKERDLIKYLSTNSGLNGSLSDLADLADNVQSMIYNKAEMPGWIERPTSSGYTKQRLIKEILEYAEAHQIQCAFDEPCAQSMAGLWLNQIIGLMKDKVNNSKMADRKAHLYACHTETVLSLMKLMKMNVSETPTSAGVIIEFKTSPPSVRTLFHEPHPQHPGTRLAHKVDLPFCAGQSWCPLDTFVQNVGNIAFSDWQEYCGLPKCPV